MRGLSAYKNVSTHSASPEQLLLLLYERAIQDQRDAIEYIKADDITSANDSMRHAREILVELAAALDHAAAPELSANLHRLYMWCVRLMLKAGQTQDIQHIEESMGIVQELYEGWRSAIHA